MFSVPAAATFSLCTQETPDLLSCCKKLSLLDKHLLSSSRKRKSLWCAKKDHSPSARIFKGIK